MIILQSDVNAVMSEVLYKMMVTKTQLSLGSVGCAGCRISGDVINDAEIT